jgi:spermidine synthase
VGLIGRTRGAAEQTTGLALTDVVERITTPRGELVLRHSGEHFEVISNGTFLMDTRGGESERLLVNAALGVHDVPQRVLIAGLGVGYSLAEALADKRVESVTVVEIEPALLDWHRSHLAPWSAGSLDDPRTTVALADLANHLRETTRDYDVICLDVDNGPEWTVTPANAALYDDTGTALLVSCLAPRGVLSVWGAARSRSYEAIVRRHLTDVVVHEVPVVRGEPDVVVVGRRRHPVGTTPPDGVRR